MPSDAAGSQRIELYYVFPLDQEDESLSLIRSTVIISGIALTLFVVGIGVLVTRLVVDPVRRAAGAAQRLAEGQLEERMTVRGEDDLAALATASTPGGQPPGSDHQAGGDVAAAAPLHQRCLSRAAHPTDDHPDGHRRPARPAATSSRTWPAPRSCCSAELDRFEALLTDLLEISRYDAGAAVAGARADRPRRRSSAGWSPAAPGRAARAASAHRPAGRARHRRRRRAAGGADPAQPRGQRHRARRGPSLEITLAANRTAAAVTVRDLGVGLSSADAQHVFDRFWRADPSRVRTVGGSGLGLSISLEDARLHGGWLQVWGQPGAGAQFRLTLPLVAGGDLISSPLPLRPAVVRRPGSPV